MTRKDYERIAEAIRVVRKEDDMDDATIERVTGEMAWAFYEKDRFFSFDWFFAICGY